MQAGAFALASTVAYRAHALSHVSRLVMCLILVAFLVLADFPALVRYSDNKSEESTNSPRSMTWLCGKGTVMDSLHL